MNLNHDYEIHYEENTKIIDLINTPHKFWAILIKDEQLLIEAHYDKLTKNMIVLNGTLGMSLQNTNFSEEVKLARIIEFFNNELWNYFHQI